jgi:hypothetical protein
VGTTSSARNGADPNGAVGVGHRPDAAAPLSDRLCDGVTIWFAVWALCTHAVVAAGGSLQQLLVVFAVAAAATGFAIRRAKRRAPSPPSAAPEPAPSARGRLQTSLQRVGIAGGVAAVAVAAMGGGVATLWWSALLLLAFATGAFLLAEAPVEQPPARGRMLEVALFAMALVCVVVALVVHRPDYDDAFYLNVAVAAADFPARALLARDTLLGIENIPLHMPAHRVHTYELWNGALAYLTGVRASFLFHWFSAGLFAALAVFAHAKLFRQLTPRIWPWAVAALLVVLIGVGETHRWFGNFALVRIWQGKGIYLFVFMPLVYSYAIAFALRPTPARWLLLAAAQIAAVGSSSSAIWGAPVGAWMALCCVLRPNRAGLLRLAIGAAASAYVIAIGFLMKGDLQPMLAPMIDEFAFGSRLDEALRFTLGHDRLRIFGIAALLLAWAVNPRGLAQRFAIALPFAAWLVLLNPYLDRWISGNVTGPSYWRAMWALPIPILMVLLLIAPLRLARGPARHALSRVAFVAGCAAFLVFVPKFSAVSERNVGAGDVGIRIGLPRRKVPAERFRWAAALNRAVPPGSNVVAPPDVGMWLPTMHGYAHPLQVRKLYLKRQVAHLGEHDVALRLLMTQYVGGGAADVPNAGAHFARGLERYAITGVVLRNSGRAVEARRTLEEGGFRRKLHAIDYELWVRP